MLTQTCNKKEAVMFLTDADLTTQQMKKNLSFFTQTGPLVSQEFSSGGSVDGEISLNGDLQIQPKDTKFESWYKKSLANVEQHLKPEQTDFDEPTSLNLQTDKLQAPFHHQNEFKEEVITIRAQSQAQRRQDSISVKSNGQQRRSRQARISERADSCSMSNYSYRLTVSDMKDLDNSREQDFQNVVSAEVKMEIENINAVQPYILIDTGLEAVSEEIADDEERLPAATSLYHIRSESSDESSNNSEYEESPVKKTAINSSIPAVFNPSLPDQTIEQLYQQISMFDNLTEQDDIEARGEFCEDTDEGEDGGGRHRIARYRKKIENYNQDLHHDLLCDGEGGESGEEEEEEEDEAEEYEETIENQYRKPKNSSRPQNLDLLPSTYINQEDVEDLLEDCGVVDDQIMQESIFSLRYAGEESSEHSIEEQVNQNIAFEQDGAYMPGETMYQDQECKDSDSCEADGAQSANTPSINTQTFELADQNLDLQHNFQMFNQSNESSSDGPDQMVLLQQKQEQLDEAHERISKMQEEIYSLSKQLASHQRNQYDLEKQLIAKSQRLSEKENETSLMIEKIDSVQTQLAAQAQSEKRKFQMNNDMMAYQRIVRDQNNIIEQLHRSQQEDQSLIKILQLENEKLRKQNKVNTAKSPKRQQMIAQQQEKPIKVKKNMSYCWETQETQRAFVPPMLFSDEQQDKFQTEETPQAKRKVYSGKQIKKSSMSMYQEKKPELKSSVLSTQQEKKPDKIQKVYTTEEQKTETLFSTLKQLQSKQNITRPKTPLSASSLLVPILSTTKKNKMAELKTPNKDN